MIPSDSNPNPSPMPGQTVNPRLVFLVGCPRSGTTWLQLLLAQHPGVATMEETHLFPEYVSPMIATYRAKQREQRKIGVEICMDEARFLEPVRQFAMGILRGALADKPRADVILEKTPGHVHHGGDILALFPDAHFVHIVRDPRAVVASLLDAGRSWAARWAPRDAADGAHTWRRAVEHAAALSRMTRRFTEISYEALHRSPEVELARLMEALRLPALDGFCARAVAACSRSNLKQGGSGVWTPKSMAGNLNVTLRRGETEGWRSELSRMQVASIEVVAGDQMRRFGYEPEQVVAGRPPAGWYLHRTAHRVLRLARRVAGR